MSTYSSFISTPIKSSVYKTGQSTSPKKISSKMFQSTIISNSSYRKKSDQNESAESSLIVKLIENQVLSQQQYQNLLIHNKELQIKVLALQQEAQRLRKDFKKVNSPIEELKNKISNANASLVEKRKYLQKFYLHLDAKLKSNMHSNLFGRLQKIQKTLEKKFQEQKHDLYVSLVNQHKKIESASNQLQKLREYRDQLIKAYTQRAIQVSSQRIKSENIALSVKTPSQKKSLNKSSNQLSQKKSIKSRFIETESIKGSVKQPIKQKLQIKNNSKNEKRLAKQQYKRQCKFLKQNIQKLKKQKQIVEKDQKILKLLLNIDQEHKKYSGYILGGYKKMFTIKYREILLNRKRQSTIKAKSDLKVSSQGSMPDFESLQKQLNQKVAQRKILEKQIEQRNITLENCKQMLNEQIGQYSLLQQQLSKANSKNTDRKVNDRMDNDLSSFNPRSTYTGNLSVENHRSTYTSYQKRSEGFQQDL